MGSVIGLDVHKDSIAAAIIDPAGRVIGEATFDNTDDAHQQLHRWIDDHAERPRVGLEPSGGVGNAAATRLVAAGIDVVLVSPRLSSRQARRGQRGKTDPIDAIAIGRVVLQEARLPPFQPHGYERDLKLLVDYRDQIHRERTRTANRLHADLAIAYPGYQRSIGKALTSRRALNAVGTLIERDTSVRADLIRRRLDRLRQIDTELRELEATLEVLVADSNTTLTEIVGISTLVAARILGEVGDVTRFPTASSFAAGNGTSPLPASSGRTDRHRLNRGGNRRLNKALYTIALTQTRHEPRARAYLERKRAEGKTRREALRCLKRRLSDVVYRQLIADAQRRRPTPT